MAARCAWSNRCKKRPEVRVTDSERYCKGHATKTADALVGTYVKHRDGWRCQLVSFDGKPCSDRQVYWCHLIPKGRYGSVRWIPDNAVAGCAGHHKAFDEAWIEKARWCERWLGDVEWQALQDLAVSSHRPDPADVILEFRPVVAALEEPDDELPIIGRKA